MVLVSVENILPPLKRKVSSSSEAPALTTRLSSDDSYTIKEKWSGDLMSNGVLTHSFFKTLKCASSIERWNGMVEWEMRVHCTGLDTGITIFCCSAGWVVGGWWRYKKRAARKKCVIDRGGTTDHSEYSLERCNEDSRRFHNHRKGPYLDRKRPLALA